MNIKFQFTRPCGARRHWPPLGGYGTKVSIHAPVRGATFCGASGPRRPRVSIHAPVRGATFEDLPHGAGDGFQFTRPCGARPSRATISARRRSFNSRARAGRDGRILRVLSPSPRFNSRARAGRDATRASSAHGADVSIHAPVRGATMRTRREGPKPGFNSRARAGRDRMQGVRRDIAHVSIHAPVRGATPASVAFEMLERFQFTRPCGARPVAPVAPLPPTQFQFTRPCGARLRAGSGRHPRRFCFNSRARAGRDGTVNGTVSDVSVFQFTRPCGARLALKFFLKK